MKQLVELQGFVPRFQELGYRLIAVGPDTPELAAGVMADHGLTFPVVSDEGLALTREFGIVYQAPEEDPLPVPAVYLVDGSGTITFHFVRPDYELRLDPELLLAAARASPARKPGRP